MRYHNFFYSVVIPARPSIGNAVGERLIILTHVLTGKIFFFLAKCWTPLFKPDKHFSSRIEERGRDFF